MILTKEVEVKIHPRNFTYFKNLGYINLKLGDIITIPVEHLSEGSGKKIKVKCDICGKEKTLSYINYNKNVKNYNYYSCSQKCARKKVEKTNLKKYGTKAPLQNKKIHKKQKQTNKERYGVQHLMQNKNIKKKAIQTNLEKYGVECTLKNKKVQDKIEKTNIERYETKFPIQNEDVKNKSKQTNLKRYGVENPMQNKRLFDKNQKSGFSRKKYKDTKLHYQANYELHFLDLCFNNDIAIINGPSIKYLFESLNKTYHSDFFLKKHNLIIEIKSTYYYKKYLKKNLAKQKSCIQQGYNFMFIIDKNYNNFASLIDKDFF